MKMEKSVTVIVKMLFWAFDYQFLPFVRINQIAQFRNELVSTCFLQTFNICFPNKITSQSYNCITIKFDVNVN